ncbi:MAG TPA: RNA polymerase sigma factor [Armatimonadota bacterium]
MAQDPEEMGLADLARRGDHGAFARLCARHRERVWRIVSSAAASPADAEDLAQEAVLRAYQALAGFGGRCAFGSWLCRIALNVAHDHLRSAWRRRVVLCDEEPDPAGGGSTSAEALAEQRERQRRVRQSVAALPPKQALPIALHYFEGYSLAELARLEGTKEATLRSRVRAGLRRLEPSLRDLVGEDAAPPLAVEPEPEGCEV